MVSAAGNTNLLLDTAISHTNQLLTERAVQLLTQKGGDSLGD